MAAVNVPNALTVLRILLVPILVVALLDRTEGGDILAAAVFAFASVTDAADGWLARSRDAVTTFGKVVDPIADKLLVLASLLTLVALDRLPLWVALVVLAREAAVTLARARADVVIPAATWGKVKTGVQVLTILLLMLFNPSPAWLDALVLVMVAVTVASGVAFFLKLRGQRPAASSHSRTDV
jgi:CDP-diacylglycerol---glycerol-3-phosphate 3-phosphatidyltransferase